MSPCLLETNELARKTPLTGLALFRSVVFQRNSPANSVAQATVTTNGAISLPMSLYGASSHPTLAIPPKSMIVSVPKEGMQCRISSALPYSLL